MAGTRDDDEAAIRAVLDGMYRAVWAKDFEASTRRGTMAPAGQGGVPGRRRGLVLPLGARPPLCRGEVHDLAQSEQVRRGGADCAAPHLPC
jgi:hypothetical protein